MAKILVTGASGMLGGDVVRELSNRNEVRATDLIGPDYLDVRNEIEVEEAVRCVDYVVHLAALTDLEYCELRPQEAAGTNARGTLNVAMACRRHRKFMVYVSTAGVFDGKQSSYSEDDRPNPINEYGRSKYFGELFVRELLDEYIIVRAGWMMGGGSRDKKFVKKILDQVDSGSRVIHVVDDKFGTPTYTLDFAVTLSTLIEQTWRGIFHMACSGECSRFDVACEMMKILGRHDMVVIPVTSDYFSSKYWVDRPRSEILETKSLDSIGLNKMRPWKDALSHYLVTT